MNSDSSITGPVNLGNPIERTIRELAELVLELTCSEATIVERELPGDDPTRRRPDISRAKDLLAWTPKVDLKLGLEKTITWFQTEATSSASSSEQMKLAL